MEKTGVVHFTLGERFGIILTNLAQEHIQYNYNLQKGIDAIEKGLVGIPRDMVLDVLSGNKIIGVDGDNCFIVNWQEGVHNVLGYRKFNPSKWCDDEIEKLVKSGEELADTMDNYIGELKFKRNGHITVDFNSSSLMKYIFDNDDSEMFLELEDEVKPYRQLQIIVDAYLEKANTVISCLKDLYLLSQTDECKGKPEWTIDIPPTLQVVINIKSQIKELIAVTMSNDTVRKLQMSSSIVANFKNSQAESLLDKYLDAQREIDVIEKDGIKPSDITQNLNAYWLAPNGDAYGLNGEIANMLHNQIADMLITAGIVDVGEADDRIADSKMMEEGWLKLHNGEVLGDHAYHGMLITQAQKDQLIKYCTVQPTGVIYMNYRLANQYISKARLEMTELGALTNMLDFGMRKNNNSKPSVKNIRNNPNFM